MSSDDGEEFGIDSGDEHDFSAGEDDDLDLFDNPEFDKPRLTPQHPENCAAVNSVRMQTLNEGKIPAPWIHNETIIVRLTMHRPVNYLWFREPDLVNTLTDIYEFPLNSKYLVGLHKLQEGIFRYSDDDGKLHYQCPEDPQSIPMRSKAFAEKLAELDKQYRDRNLSKAVNDANASEAIFTIAWKIDDEDDEQTVVDDAPVIPVGTNG